MQPLQHVPVLTRTRRDTSKTVPAGRRSVVSFRLGARGFELSLVIGRAVRGIGKLIPEAALLPSFVTETLRPLVLEVAIAVALGPRFALAVLLANVVAETLAAARPRSSRLPLRSGSASRWRLLLANIVTDSSAAAPALNRGRDGACRRKRDIGCASCHRCVGAAAAPLPVPNHAGAGPGSPDAACPALGLRRGNSVAARYLVRGCAPTNGPLRRPCSRSSSRN